MRGGRKGHEPDERLDQHILYMSIQNARHEPSSKFKRLRDRSVRKMNSERRYLVPFFSNRATQEQTMRNQDSEAPEHDGHKLNLEPYVLRVSVCIGIISRPEINPFILRLLENDDSKSRMQMQIAVTPTRPQCQRQGLRITVTRR